jgi:hypothetical protein
MKNVYGCLISEASPQTAFTLLVSDDLCTVMMMPLWWQSHVSARGREGRWLLRPNPAHHRFTSTATILNLPL